MDMKKAAPKGDLKDQMKHTPAANDGQPPKPAYQQERVLLAMMYTGSITAQEAERAPIYARHLNSVVSELSNRMTLTVLRQPEKVRGYAKQVCTLNRYRLAEDQLDKAKLLIDHWRSKRGADPIYWSQLTLLPLASYFNLREVA
ncbi:hypothetical protein [Shewanella mangrovi]|uniref:hypothetical protein n=1 Tax=Shewanella mangrovi TaxID=1515746 RepID=UPI00068A49F6|nr:hypothetical protein [Shewanella mangrovi]